MNGNILDKSVIICALARDCAPALAKNIPRIEELRAFFTVSQVIIIENDSIDDTKEVLQYWKNSSSNINLLMDNFSTKTLPEKNQNNPHPGTSTHRISKMVTYRNKYLNWIRERNLHPDYVIIIDVDVESFSVNGILDSIKDAPTGWGALFAFGNTDLRVGNVVIHRLYHDLYAHLEQLPESKPYLTHAKMFKTSKGITKKIDSQRFFPVVSAFGGIGIYKFEALVDLEYNCEKNNDELMEAICEHIPFNIAVTKKGYQNYVCHGLDVHYGESNKVMIVRNLLPLPIFKLLAFMLTLRWLKA